MIPPQPPANRGRCGFTVIELLVVVGVIGVLLGLILPLIGRVREKARLTRCASNLRQIGVATFAYTADNDTAFPWAGRDWQRTGFRDVWALLRPSIGDGSFYVCPSDFDPTFNQAWVNLNGPAFGVSRSDLPFPAPYFYYWMFFQKFNCQPYGQGAQGYQTMSLRDVTCPARKAMFVCFAQSPDLSQGFAHQKDAMNLLFADGHAALTALVELAQPETPSNEARPNANLQWTRCGIHGFDLK